MQMKSWLKILSIGALSVALVACTNSETPQTDQQQHEQQPNANNGNMDHGQINHDSNNPGSMDHSGHSGEIPQGLKEAKNPTYKVGSQVILQDDHMPGMKGATATISGAYDTTVYAVSYTPTTGGEKVTNHKWVIHEDLQNAGLEPYKAGDQVTLAVEHMPGMKGATATIDYAEQTTVYMVDYTPTHGGQPIKNHQWFIGSELSPKSNDTPSNDQAPAPTNHENMDHSKH